MQVHRAQGHFEKAPAHLAPPRETSSRKRSNSQSQAIPPPVTVQPRNHARNGTAASNGKHSTTKKTRPAHAVSERHQAEFYVTLQPLNDTFVRKHIHVPYYPEVCKLGRPTGTKMKPSVTNGYFDSRVLSRNHACLFVEPQTGQLMIQDMGSSNGTYVNQEKIASEPVAIKIGDRINLGFNIQVETSHKQISAVVEDINVVSNTPSAPMLDGLPKLTPEAISKLSGCEKRHLDFLQDLFEQISSTKRKVPEEEDDSTYANELKTSKAFEQGMFSDVAPSLEDVFNASTTDPASSGVFTNFRFVKPNDIESTLNALVVNLAKVKQQNNSLRSLENFFGNYSAKLNDINDQFLRSEAKKQELRFERELEAQSSRLETQVEDHKKQINEKNGILEYLESELERLKLERAELRAELEDQKKALSASKRKTEKRREEREREHSEAKSKHHEVDISAFDFGTGKLIKEASSEGSEDVEEISNSSDIGSEDSTSHRGVVPGRGRLQGPEGSLVKNPYMGELLGQASQLRTRGVAVGLVVILAGFVYQSCHK